MALWGGWVFDTVVTRRWCVVKGDYPPEVYLGRAGTEEILSSPAVVVQEEQQGDAFSKVQDGLGPRVRYLMANPPKWVPGSAGEIWDAD